jgi:hypothetical protein
MAIRERIENKEESQMFFWDVLESSEKDIHSELQILREKQERLRKGIFQRMTDMSKKINILESELSMMKMLAVNGKKIQ